MSVLVAALRAALGDHAVVAADPYLEDITEHPAGHAVAAVTVTKRSDVAVAMRIAAEHGAGVTPVVAGYNVAGIAIPHGGIVLDLRQLQGIEIDEDTMTAVVEPGVTFGQLADHLAEHHPGLTYAYPFAPPFTSVLANALLDGLNNLSVRHGAMGRWLTGVEAVLADGTTVRTGTGGVVGETHGAAGWFARAPLPDLTGLFVSTQGTTGVVVRGGLSLVPARAHRRRWFSFCWSLDAAYEAMRGLGRSGSVDDVGLMTWPAAKLLFGATRNLVRAADEPLAFLFVDLTGSTAAELAARERFVRDALAEAGCDAPFDVNLLVDLVPHLAKLAELPTTLDFLLDFPGGGLAWVGSYGPGRSWVAGAKAGGEILERYGFPPFVVARPMEGGRYFVLRFVACFDRGDDEEVERVRWCMGELADLVLDLGYVPYKASADAAARISARAHPGWNELLRRTRDALDPDRRMNPGRWPE